MSISSRVFLFNDQVSAHPDEIPIISPDSSKIIFEKNLKSIWKDVVKEALKAQLTPYYLDDFDTPALTCDVTYPLREKVIALRQLIQNTETAKVYITESKLMQALRAALTVCVVAGSVLGMVTMGHVAAIPILLATIVAYSLIANYPAYEIGVRLLESGERSLLIRIGMAFSLLIGGPFLCVDDVTRFEDRVNAQKAEIEDWIKKMIQCCKRDLSNFSNHLRELLHLRKRLYQIELLKNESVFEPVPEEIAKYQTALDEFRTLIDYYERLGRAEPLKKL